MEKNKKLELISQHQRFERDVAYQQTGMRDGIPLEKGVALNEDYLEKNKEHIEDVFAYFTAYPDLFLDLIGTEGDNFSLFFYQRIFLRACMRFKTVYWVACRACSKSFLTILALMLQCIFVPGSKRFICAPHINQGAKIAREKIIEVYQHWPLIRREVVGGDVSDVPGNFGKDYVRITFKNGSVFDVVGTTSATLGGRRHSGLIDEVKEHEEEDISTIILPLMNVSRRQPNGIINEKEPNQQVIYCTSAWNKQSFAYDKLISVLEESIMRPQTAFCMSCDYRVPMMHGLVSKDFIMNLKLDPSFNENSFATEYLSLWRGVNSDSWFNFDKLSNYRKIKNPELRAKNGAGQNYYYLISVDVGRLNDQTVASIFRVNIDKAGKHHATLVNLRVLARQANTKTFTQQTIDIKRLIRDYEPREVVIDINGLGIGLADEMIKPQYDEKGEYYPPYGFFNDDEYIAIQPRDALNILYGIKANLSLNSKIHSNVYSRISNGLVHFLIKEQEAKSALMATKIGQKMTTQQRVERLLPHEMTTRLFDEMARQNWPLVA